MTYTNDEFTRLIDANNIDTIFEIGCHDGYDTLRLIDHYKPKQIHTFECNPEAISICKNTYNGYDNIKFNKLAVWKYSGNTKFYPVIHSYHKHVNPTGDPCKFEKNIGMSSCYRESGIYGEKIIQDEIIVPCITLDDYCKQSNIREIDLMCMDVQGAEFDILENSKSLDNVKYIILEINRIEVYKGQKIYNDIIDLMNSRSFRLLKFLDQCEWFGDGLFVNER